MADSRDDCFRECALHDYHSETEPGGLPNPAHAPVTAEQQAAIALRLYKPIKQWQTRILKVLPGPVKAPLEAELHVSYMIEGPGMVLRDSEEWIEYSALSYCWGAPVYDHELLTNDVQYPVTETLFQGLRRLRSVSEPFYIWVDAVCIHQYDLAERSSQVTNMLGIYKKAETVVVWLGEHMDDSRIAFTCASSIDNLDQTESDGVNDTDVLTKLCRWHREMLSRGLENIARRPWFARVWVKQEIWAANSLFVMMGPNKISWTSFRNVEALANTVGKLTASGESGPEMRLTRVFQAHFAGLVTASTDDHTRAQLTDQPNPILLERDHQYRHGADIVVVLRRCVAALCNNPSDRIYAVVGMTTTNISQVPTQTAALAIDYEKPVAELFRDLTRYLINRDGCLAALLLKATLGGLVEDGKLPSWTIDWRYPTAHNSWVDVHRQILRLVDNVWRPRSMPVVPHQSPDTSHELSLSGCCIGIVQDDTPDTEWVTPMTSGVLFRLTGSQQKDGLRDHLPAELEDLGLSRMRGYVAELIAGRPVKHIIYPPDPGKKPDYRKRTARVLLMTPGVDFGSDHRSVSVSTKDHDLIDQTPGGDVQLKRGHHVQTETFILRRIRRRPLVASRYDKFQHEKHVTIRMQTGAGIDYSQQPTFPLAESTIGSPKPVAPNPTRALVVHSREEVVSKWTAHHSVAAGDRLMLFDASPLGLLVRPVVADGSICTYVGPAMINRGDWCRHDGLVSVITDHDRDFYGDFERQAKVFTELRRWLTENLSPEQVTLV